MMGVWVLERGGGGVKEMCSSAEGGVYLNDLPLLGQDESLDDFDVLKYVMSHDTAKLHYFSRGRI